MKKILIVLLSLFLLLAALALHPVNHRKSIHTSGIVSLVRQSKGSGDIQIQVLGDEHMYYLNRAEEKGITFKALEGNILNKKIQLTYASHRTPLNPFGKIRPVSSILIDDSESIPIHGFIKPYFAILKTSWPF